jgi:predicted outer membrane repeat protein
MSRMTFRFIPVLLLAVLLAGLTPRAYAAVINVACDAADLRTAIDTANSGDVLELAASCDYVLDAGSAGDATSAFVIDSRSLVINGHSATIRRSDVAGTLFRIFSLNNADLTLNDLTLRHGDVVNFGGAILSVNSTLAVNNSTLTDNFGGNEGGALYNDSGTATLTNVTISSNGATDYGGAIRNFNGGTVNLNGGSVSDNRTLGNDGGGITNSDLGSTISVNGTSFTNNSTPASGGAIANIYQQGTVEITGATFTGNTAGGSVGGAIYNGENGTLTVADSTFTDNIASGGSDQGGAIYNGGTSATITGSSFSGNQAYYGSAIATGGLTTTMEISSSTFTNNGGSPLPETTAVGGAIWSTGGGVLNVFTSTFNGNSVSRLGGAIYTDAFGDTGTQTTVTNSTFFGNTASNGGAIGSDDAASITIHNSTIARNQADVGGGLWNDADSLSMSVGSSIVAENTDSTPAPNDLSGDITSLGYNVVGTTAGGNLSANATDLTDAAASPLNLGGLASNGGSTQTMALGAGSVAIGAGNCAGIPTDQRGAARKTPCDSGAFETAAVVPPEPPHTGDTSAPAAITPIDALCDAFGALTGSQISASGGVQNVSSGGSTYCHLIALNGRFFTNPGEIGIQSVIDLGVIHAINVFPLPAGTLTSPVTICLSGGGDVLFINAADRSISRLPVGANGCVLVTSPGLVVMVRGQSGIAAPPAAPPTGTVLNNCQVTTTDAPLNLRAEPNASATVLAKLPYDLTLNATERVPGWFRVIYLDGQGWVSVEFVQPLGDCG